MTDNTDTPKVTTRFLRDHWKEELSKFSDRTADVRAPLNRLLDAWGFDLSSRSPGVAFVDEQGVPVTDLDLACFMSALAEPRAVINIPEYMVRRAKTVTEGQMTVSSDNRHGPILNLSSNQDTFSFGVVISDAQVIDADGNIGLPRTYIMQDINGTWYKGWKSIELLQQGLTGDVFDKLAGALQSLKFQYYVHPLRWPSFYGVPHLLALAADARLGDQLKFIRKERKRLQEALDIPPKVWPKSTKVGEEKKIKVWAFNVALDGFDLKGEYKPYEATQESYDNLELLRKRLESQQKSLRFQMRATHYAFYTEAFGKNVPKVDYLDWLKGENPNLQLLQPKKAGWVKDKIWETGYKEKKGARVNWARMEIRDGYHIRFKLREKSEKVSAESEE